MGHAQDGHDDDGVVDGVDDPVVADLHPPQIRVADESPGARGAWVGREVVDSLDDPPGHDVVEPGQLLEGTRVVADGV